MTYPVGSDCVVGSGFYGYPSEQPSEGNDSQTYYIEVVPPYNAQTCDTYTLNISTGDPENILTVIGTTSFEGDSDWYKVFAVDTVTAEEQPNYVCLERECAQTGWRCVDWNLFGHCIDYVSYCVRWGDCIDAVNTADMDPFRVEFWFDGATDSEYSFNVYKGGPPGTGSEVCANGG
jgi:hypothetical protein